MRALHRGCRACRPPRRTGRFDRGARTTARAPSTTRTPQETQGNQHRWCWQSQFYRLEHVCSCDDHHRRCWTKKASLLPPLSTGRIAAQQDTCGSSGGCVGNPQSCPCSSISSYKMDIHHRTHQCRRYLSVFVRMKGNKHADNRYTCVTAVEYFRIYDMMYDAVAPYRPHAL